MLSIQAQYYLQNSRSAIEKNQKEELGDYNNDVQCTDDSRVMSQLQNR